MDKSVSFVSKYMFIVWLECLIAFSRNMAPRKSKNPSKSKNSKSTKAINNLTARVDRIEKWVLAIAKAVNARLPSSEDELNNDGEEG